MLPDFDWPRAIVAGTGHRPQKLGGFALGVERKLYDLARTWFAERRPGRIISGMALGWDQALARAALDIDLAVTAAVPFAGQDMLWPSEARTAYRDLLERIRATPYGSVTTVSLGAYDPTKMHIRNAWMVDNANAVLALWDGSKGGTGSCIAYAVRTGKPVINLWDRWHK